jgi:two-component system response regulator GlrR
VRVDTRVISSTHRDLNELIASGQFREDLFYRLNVVNIHLPPLRERREDVPLLIEHFLDQIAAESGQKRRVYAPEAVELMVAHDWPGNVRQLFNVVSQNVALCSTHVIPVEMVRNAIGDNAEALPSFTEARDEFTRDYLSRLLQITGGNVSQAARLAKRNRTDFYKLLSRHSLVPERFK